MNQAPLKKGNGIWFEGARESEPRTSLSPSPLDEVARGGNEFDFPVIPG